MALTPLLARQSQGQGETAEQFCHTHNKYIEKMIAEMAHTNSATLIISTNIEMMILKHASYHPLACHWMLSTATVKVVKNNQKLTVDKYFINIYIFHLPIFGDISTVNISTIDVENPNTKISFPLQRRFDLYPNLSELSPLWRKVLF